MQMRDFLAKDGLSLGTCVCNKMSGYAKKSVEATRRENHGQRVDVSAQSEANATEGLGTNDGDPVRTDHSISNVSMNLIQASELELNCYSQPRNNGFNDLKRPKCRIALHEGVNERPNCGMRSNTMNMKH